MDADTERRLEELDDTVRHLQNKLIELGKMVGAIAEATTLFIETKSTEEREMSMSVEERDAVDWVGVAESLPPCGTDTDYVVKTRDSGTVHPVRCVRNVKDYNTKKYFSGWAVIDQYYWYYEVKDVTHWAILKEHEK